MLTWLLFPPPARTSSSSQVGPYFVRKPLFLALGGFSANWSATGEPGGHFDAEYCFRLWTATSTSTCGMYYAGVGNGVGGHKTRVGAQGRARRRNQRRAALAMRELWSLHNASVVARVASENGQLRAHAAPDDALALQVAQGRESRQSCLGRT